MACIPAGYIFLSYRTKLAGYAACASSGYGGGTITFSALREQGISSENEWDYFLQLRDFLHLSDRKSHASSLLILCALRAEKAIDSTPSCPTAAAGASACCVAGATEKRILYHALHLSGTLR